ncbi:hypothetical protein BZZ01_19830 [Nostocales cyanobacterium HT-58-2]|nr:hypothetical protein BZZ01_19830 [Nostocales cyanobacterium HT-58-2]
MLVSSLIALEFSIALFLVSAKIANQIWQMLATLIALFYLGISFIFSPVPIEVMIAIALLNTTKQIHILNHNN